MHLDFLFSPLHLAVACFWFLIFHRAAGVIYSAIVRCRRNKPMIAANVMPSSVGLPTTREKRALFSGAL